MLGSGYVGLVTGCCFADLGNDVVCVDLNEKRVKQLLKGEVPFYEPGLIDLLQRNLREERITFTTDVKKSIQENDLIFICVGTPEGAEGEADLKYVLTAAADIGKYMDKSKIIILKSTVPVGTNEKVKRTIKANLTKNIDFHVVNNPEFLREGAAVKDFQNPDRIVVGSTNEEAKKILGYEGKISFNEGLKETVSWFNDFYSK